MKKDVNKSKSKKTPPKIKTKTPPKIKTKTPPKIKTKSKTTTKPKKKDIKTSKIKRVKESKKDVSVVDEVLDHARGTVEEVNGVLEVGVADTPEVVTDTPKVSDTPEVDTEKSSEVVTEEKGIDGMEMRDEYGNHYGSANHSLLVLRRRRQVAEYYIRGWTQLAIAEEMRVAVATISKDLSAIRDEWKASSLVDYDTKVAEQLARLDHLEMVAWKGWERSCENAEFTRRRIEEALEVQRGRGENQDENGEKDSRGVEDADEGEEDGGKRHASSKSYNRYSNTKINSPRNFHRNARRVSGIPNLSGRSREEKLAALIPVRMVEETTSKGQSGDPRFLEQIFRCIETRMKILGLFKDTINNNQNNVVIHWDSLIQSVGGGTNPSIVSGNAQPSVLPTMAATPSSTLSSSYIPSNAVPVLPRPTTLEEVEARIRRIEDVAAGNVIDVPAVPTTSGTTPTISNS